VTLLVHLALIAAATGIILWPATCLPTFWRWIVAIFYVLVIGHFGSAFFLCALRDWYMGEPKEDKPGIPGEFMGMFERLLFMGVVGGIASVKDVELGSALAAVVAAMAFWLGSKLLSGWNRAPYAIVQIDPKKAEEQNDRMARGAMAALMTGALNMVFAVIAGLIASGIWS